MSLRALKQGTCLWVPGVGPDAAALRRLEERAPMPTYPMGEALFMGEERRFFNELMSESPDQWAPELIDSVLGSLASGPGCFGHLQEWTDWLHFLVPRLLARIDDWRWASVYEGMVSAFMAQYPDERSEYPYDRFLADILTTLGRIPMSASNWNDGRLVVGKVISSIEEIPHGPFISCGGALSAGLFLNLKYLDEGLASIWLASVFAIEDSIWRIKLVIWIAQSSELLLKSGQQPLVLESEASFGSGWHGCWCPQGGNPSEDVDPLQVTVPFLSDMRRQWFGDELRRHLNRATLENLDADLTELEQARPDLYVIRGQFTRASREIIQDYQLR